MAPSKKPGTLGVEKIYQKRFEHWAPATGMEVMLLLSAHHLLQNKTKLPVPLDKDRVRTGQRPREILREVTNSYLRKW